MSDAVTQSADLTELIGALHLFQTQMPVVPKNSVNPFFNSKYADLGDVRKAAVPVLSANGLVVSQFPTVKGLKTYLFHTSGQWIAEEMELSTGGTPQGQGSALTYARRYAFCAVLGIVADADDDGNAANTEAGGIQAHAQQKQAVATPGPQDQYTGPPTTSPNYARVNQAADRAVQSGDKKFNGPPPWPQNPPPVTNGSTASEGQGRRLFAICKKAGLEVSRAVSVMYPGLVEADLSGWQNSYLADAVLAGWDPRSHTAEAAGTAKIEEAFGDVAQVADSNGDYGHSQAPFEPEF